MHGAHWSRLEEAQVPPIISTLHLCSRDPQEQMQESVMCLIFQTGGGATKPAPWHTFLEHSRTLVVSDGQDGAEQSMGWKLQARWSDADPDMSGLSCQVLIKRANQLSVL